MRAVFCCFSAMGLRICLGWRTAWCLSMRSGRLIEAKWNKGGRRVWEGRMADDAPRPPQKDSNKQGDDGQLWKLLGIGLELALVMVVAVWAGRWVDAKFGWAPWGTMVISMTALAVVLYLTLKDVNK